MKPVFMLPNKILTNKILTVSSMEFGLYAIFFLFFFFVLCEVATSVLAEWQILQVVRLQVVEPCK